MIKSLKIINKQILIILVFSIISAVVAIIHGIFFDLDLGQIKRLTLEGIILTFFVIFPIIIFLEYVFDINNKKELDKINRRLAKLEKKK